MSRKAQTTGKPIFVVHLHKAKTLHYDFRVEIGGVLKSWAVPKGPSTDPKQRRLAVLVEDHELGYADFEGVIPEGEPGGGAVIVWDKGTYINLKKHKGQPVPIEESFKNGIVEVWLEGKKLKGGYVIVRTEIGGKSNNWLLIKMVDDYADPSRNPVENEPESVISGRTIEEVEREGINESK